MTAISQTVQRARRAAVRYRQRHEQTGSIGSTLRYMAWMMLRRLPVAIDKARSAARYSSELSRIATIKASGGDLRPFIGIKFSGGLGDALVVARFVRDLSAHAGGFDFDIYGPQPAQAKWAFSSVGGLRACHGDGLFDLTASAYDLVAHISQFVVFDQAAARNPGLRSHPGLDQAVRHAARYRAKIEPFIANHPHMDGYLAQKAVYSNLGRADFLHGMAGIEYGGDDLSLPVEAGMPARHGLTAGHYVTIHNGFDPEFFTSSRQATKCYPHFGAVVDLLRQKRPYLKFVQIGVGTSQPLAEVDIDLVDRTSLAEAAGLIGGALMHVDNEGGLVHLARCLGVDSAVVFGPTPSNYFGYPGNVNIDPPFCGGCWWSNETWMERCPRGFETPRCMTEQNPVAVASAIDRHLAVKSLSRPMVAPVTL